MQSQEGKVAESLLLKWGTIKGWDNFSEKSQAKRLRKPKETLVHFVSVGFALVQRKFDDIRAKPSMPNGRMNPHTVLLWGHKKMSK